MDKIRVAVLQMNIAWEKPADNIRNIEDYLVKSAETADVFVLPEMFTTGFSMKSVPLAERMNGESMTWLQSQAERNDLVICGSLMIEEAGNYYNRFIWMLPDGTHEIYDKRHLFSFAKEDTSFTAGKERVTIDYKGWRIFPIICYDLRFPVWSRQDDTPYDLLICPANFPAVRSDAWSSLLKARAIENQSYVVGCNRVGVDGKNIAYQGDSQVIDFEGKILLHLGDQESVAQTEINKKELMAFRQKYPFLKDRDRFELVI